VLLAGTISVGVLAGLSLIMTYGVVRRLREHDRQLAQLQAVLTPGPATPALRAPVAEFVASTVDGVEVTHRDFREGESFVGLFSTHCTACHEQLPRFIEAVAHADPRRVLIVLADDGDAGVLARFRAQALAAGQVVIEQNMGPVATAFGIDRWPTMLVLQDAVVTVNVHTADGLSVPASA
jgi:hypothetical protein